MSRRDGGRWRGDPPGRGERTLKGVASWAGPPGGRMYARPNSEGGPPMATELKRALHHAAEWERHHVSHIPRPHLSRSLRGRSLEDRVAGGITDFAGSM